jgi:hypothetical protein
MASFHSDGAVGSAGGLDRFRFLLAIRGGNFRGAGAAAGHGEGRFTLFIELLQCTAHYTHSPCHFESGSGMFYIRLRPSTAIGCGTKQYSCDISHVIAVPGECNCVRYSLVVVRSLRGGTGKDLEHEEPSCTGRFRQQYNIDHSIAQSEHLASITERTAPSLYGKRHRPAAS